MRTTTTIFDPALSGALTSTPWGDLKSGIWITRPYLSFSCMKQSTVLCIVGNRYCWVFSIGLSRSTLPLFCVAEGWPSASMGFLILWLLAGFSPWEALAGDRGEEGKWALGVNSSSSVSAGSPRVTPLGGHSSSQAAGHSPQGPVILFQA